MKRLATAGLAVCVWLGFVALAHIGCWYYVNNNQWLMSSSVHYDWWQFILFWDNAYAWLWYADFSTWLRITIVYSFVIAVMFTLWRCLD